MVDGYKEIKVVIGADNYNNNPGWIHTQEGELSLLDETTWKTQFKKGSISAIWLNMFGNTLLIKKGLKLQGFAITT